MNFPKFNDGRLHEVEDLPVPEVEYPFAGEQLPDVDARTWLRRYLVQRARFAPRIATRTSYTNLVPYSNDFTNAAWTKYKLTPTSNVIANPWDGATTVGRLLEVATSGAHGIEQAVTYAAVPTTLWAIVKGGLGRNWIRLQAVDSAVTFFRGWCDIDSGLAGTATGSGCTVATPVSLGGGFWLISITFTPAAGAGDADLFLANADADTASYTGDITKGLYIAQMQAESAATPGPLILTTAAARTVSAPDRDPDDRFAYLAEESKPDILTRIHARVARLFARIPRDQVAYDTDFFSRPAIHDQVSGSCYAVSFDDLITTHLFWARKTVSSVNDPATTYLTLGNELAVLGHQQVSITLNTGTATFYLDDSDATIKDALSTAWTGDTSGAGFFYVGRWKYGCRITWAGASVTVLAINLTDTSIAIGANTVTFGTASSTGPVEIVTAQTVLTSVRTVNSTGHGGAAGNRVALYNGARLVALSTAVAVLTDAFSIPTKDLPDADAVVTHCVFDKDGLRIVNGPRDCTVRSTRRFYLPGVTPGVSTGADVPQIETYQDAPGWLSRLTATTHTSVTATAATDLITKTAHGLATGDVFWLTVATGAAGLSLLTRYFAIRVDADNFKAAATAADALAGTAIDITSDGSSITLIAPAPWPAIEASRLSAWHGPILNRTFTEIQMSDALETRPPTA